LSLRQNPIDWTGVGLTIAGVGGGWSPPTKEEKEAMSFSLFLAFRWRRIQVLIKIRF
jgi:hypothetical protein